MSRRLHVLFSVNMMKNGGAVGEAVDMVLHPGKFKIWGQIPTSDWQKCLPTVTWLLKPLALQALEGLFSCGGMYGLVRCTLRGMGVFCCDWKARNQRS